MQAARWMVLAGILCASGAGMTAAAGPEPAREPTAAGVEDAAARLAAVVESYQPADPYLANRWSQAMRSAFLYGGALRVFAAQSEPMAEWMRRASANGERTAADLMLAPLGELPAGAPVEALTAEARRLVKVLEQEELLLHLDQLAEPCRLAAPPPYRDVNSPLLSQETYELGAFKNLSIACAARMNFAFEDGQEHKALRGFVSGLRLGQAACGRPVLLGLLSGQVIQNRMLVQGMARVREGRISPEGLEVMARAVDRLRLPAAETFVEIERIIGQDAIARYFAKKAVEQLTTPDDTVPSNELTRMEAEKVFNAAMDRCIEFVRSAAPRVTGAASETGGDARRPAAPAGDPRLIDVPEGREDPDGFIASLMPPAGPLVVAELEYRCIREGARAVIMLEQHKAAQGRYPARVEELGEGVEWPRDPCAPERGLGYRAEEESGGYVVYSTGADGVDDGGKGAVVRERSALAAGARGKGRDFVILR